MAPASVSRALREWTSIEGTAAAVDRMSRLFTGALCLLLFMGFAWFFLREFKSADQQAVDVFLNAPTIENCISTDINRIKPEKLDSQVLRTMSNDCAERIHQQNFENEALLKRLKFVQQVADGRVMLWLVVVITFSGVVLAGVQLLASYKLAVIGREAFGQSMELAVEKDKASLKSSVTGLFILAISFAFFLVFVQQIYKIETVKMDPPTAVEKLGRIVEPPSDSK